MDILAKIQLPHTDDPNARKARVDSLFSPPVIEFLNAKSPMPKRVFIGYLAMLVQDLIGEVLIGCVYKRQKIIFRKKVSKQPALVNNYKTNWQNKNIQKKVTLSTLIV